jgi:hypothetical protein
MRPEERKRESERERERGREKEREIACGARKASSPTYRPGQIGSYG